MNTPTYQVTYHLAEIVHWLAPGAPIRFHRTDTGERYDMQIVANHRGGYVMLEHAPTGAAAPDFWAWDGQQRLRQLSGTEEQVARALAAGDQQTAMQAALQLWDEDIRQFVPQPTKPTTFRGLPVVRPVEDLLRALTERFWQEEHQGQYRYHPYSQVLWFPIPLPVAARFVMRAVQFHISYAAMQEDVYSATVLAIPEEPDALYSDPQGDRTDPANWTGAHPLVRWPLSTFDMKYLESGGDLAGSGQWVDALEPPRAEETRERTFDLDWLSMFIVVLASDTRDVLDAQALSEVFRAVQAPERLVRLLSRRVQDTSSD
jgi:hypothetical protein